MRCPATGVARSDSSLRAGPPRSLSLVAITAGLIWGCAAPQPTTTGHEYDEFADEPLESHELDAGDSKRVPSGYTLMDCGAEALGVVPLTVTFDDDEQLIIDWQGANALGLLVTDQEAILPAGPNDRVQGTAFWVVSTVAFPDGFAGPVVYGLVPSGGEDVTADHGGSVGGAPLMAGTCYKLSVTNNAFCTGSVVRGWE